MIKKSHIIEILSGKRPLSDTLHYLVGNYRYHIYYTQNGRLRFLIRSHILEQVKWRIKVMDTVCFEAGSCKMCGCETVQLQMCDKSCDKPCYPRMMNEREWSRFKREGIFRDKHGVWLVYTKDSDNTLGTPILTKNDI